MLPCRLALRIYVSAVVRRRNWVLQLWFSYLSSCTPVRELVRFEGSSRRNLSSLCVV